MFPAVNMLSDVSYTTLPFNMSTSLETTPSTTLSEEDPLVPLNFDDLLDIAREFEFNNTITHVWPCEEDTSTCPETELEDILAAIVPTPNVEAGPLPLLSPGTPMTLDPIHVQEFDLHRSAAVYAPSDVKASISSDPAHPSKDDDWILAEVEPPTTSTLRGWSPPNGFQFLDLDDSLMLPQSPRDVWIPPWSAMFLAPPCMQPAIGASQSPAMVPVVGEVQSQMAVTEPKTPSVSMTNETTNEPTKSATLLCLPVRHPTHAILEPISLQVNSNVSSRSAIISQTNMSRSRSHLSSIPAVGSPSTARYAKAPRGGIPPHIARTVTKANILLVEKERKVTRDAFSSTTIGEGKKPSVLRRVAKVEREINKTVSGGSSGKKPLACGENDQKAGRAAKKARV